MKKIILIALFFVGCAEMTPPAPELPKAEKKESECKIEVTNHYHNKFELNFLNKLFNDLLDLELF